VGEIVQPQHLIFMRYEQQHHHTTAREITCDNSQDPL
jgi:hypothetical protein